MTSKKIKILYTLRIMRDFNLQYLVPYPYDSPQHPVLSPSLDPRPLHLPAGRGRPHRRASDVSACIGIELPLPLQDTQRQRYIQLEAEPFLKIVFKIFNDMLLKFVRECYEGIYSPCSINLDFLISFSAMFI